MIYTVDNRVFLLGLDELFRTAMKRQESEELLHHARTLSAELHLSPKTVEVEGYYHETDELTEYFLRMRALQDITEDQVSDLQSIEAGERLQQVVTSGLFGQPEPESPPRLLPAAADPLTKAMESMRPNWDLGSLIAKAKELSESNDDFSLVALAALTGDAVVLTALRESCVLYASAVAGCALPEHDPKYLWKVSPEIESRARAFVDTFNSLFGGDLPIPGQESVVAYYNASEMALPLGRCVRIGFDPPASPELHYHWAIARNGEVEEFWDSEIWTTERYRSEKMGW